MTGIRKIRIWLPSLLIAMVAHAGVWAGFNGMRAAGLARHPVGVIEVSLPVPMAQAMPESPDHRPHIETPPPSPGKSAPPGQRTPRQVAMQDSRPRQIARSPGAIRTVTEAVPATPLRDTGMAALTAPDFSAAYLHNPPPAYPLSARRKGIEGRVLVRAEVSKEGTCRRVALKATSGDERLDRATLEAVRGWRFVPARRGEQSVVAWVEVPVSFKLKN
jgi:protein TonB